MRSEAAKTGLFIVAGLTLAIAAAWVEPEAARPQIFSDQGEPLFPRFREVDAVKAIEVVDYDDQEAVARPLKVEFRRGRWILPSHDDYPAEAGDRLAKTAAALLDLKKDIVVSDRMDDHATYGVIDPMDQEVASLTGRGKRVTLRDAQGEALAEAVLGKPDPAHNGYRYVRLPPQKRTYSVKTDAEPSARFEDWVESNLLRVSTADIRRITINSYVIDEAMGRLANVERTVLTKEGSQWKAEGKRASQSAMQSAVNTLGALHVVGARPKPKPLADQLRSGSLEMTLETVMSLRQRGFFITPSGQLLANEGEVSVETSRGLLYTIRIGSIVRGASAAAAAANADKGATADQPRYAFVTVSHSAERQDKYGGSGGGEQLARSLNQRFADWYYVVSGADLDKLKLK
ncbi:MAG: DUF4340 domain-containing protein [Bryobacteraceae bacterium]|nr:DUF4340 domain-containing protein [Bryobacteraceae bacterium]